MIDRGLLIQAIYEAAAVPGRWPAVLEAVGGTVDAPHAAFVARLSDSWTGHVMSRETDDLPKAETMTRLLGRDHPGFLSSADLFSSREGKAAPFAATAISVPAGHRLAFHIRRPEDAPAFTAADIARLDTLRPHLARSGLVGARWHLQQPATAAAALQTIGLPAAVLDREGRALLANELIEGLATHVRWRPHDRLSLVDAQADLRLQQVLAAPADGRSSCSFATRSMAGEAAVVHVLPVVGQARNIFGGRVALVAMTAVFPLSPSNLVRGLFDLSAGEALALARASVARQAELTSLLAGQPRLAPREAPPLQPVARPL
jgi:hypothetical protein